MSEKRAREERQAASKMAVNGQNGVDVLMDPRHIQLLRVIVAQCADMLGCQPSEVVGELGMLIGSHEALKEKLDEGAVSRPIAALRAVPAEEGAAGDGPGRSGGCEAAGDVEVSDVPADACSGSGEADAERLPGEADERGRGGSEGGGNAPEA